MERITAPLETVAAICGEQKEKDCAYRLSHHCLRVPCAEGELLYQTMTGELLLLPEGERVEQNRGELIRRWFLVPEDYDEYSLCRQVRQVAGLLHPKEPGVNTFLIFTTTDCNARCFYCYELRRRRQAMSEQVAHDAAAYIARVRRAKKVSLNWFGGEPLYNRRAIEIITADLRERGVAYTSRMTSNGYLFDEETVRTAKEDWRLELVQISLDGTEEVYNRSKAYIYKEGSAYRRVLRNIGLLLDAGIRVDIRLNMDSGNWEDLMRLVPELAERFRDRKGLHVYTALLQDFGTSPHRFATLEEQLERYEQLQEALREAGLAQKRSLTGKLLLNRCMADQDGSLSILPDGRLGKCEHESEDGLVGSIYGEVLDEEMLAAWKERLSDPACRSCAFAPVCLDLKKCAWYAGGCTEQNRALKRFRLAARVRSTYERERNRAAGDPGEEPGGEDPELC